MSTLRLLVLDAVAAQLPGSIRRARTRVDADRVLLEWRPDVLVFGGASVWAASFIARIPLHSRPAVLLVGADVAAAALADEWLARPEDADESATRLDLALERGRARRRSLRLAYKDPLTGLPNRRAAYRALVREAGRARRDEGRVSVVLLDLDHFKAVNERDGHVAGDALLRRVGRQLAHATRRHEVCARIGGDEFAIVIAGGIHHADAAAGRVRAALQEIGVQASMATAELAPRESLIELYRRTDDRLRAVKRARDVGESARRYRRTA